MESSSLKWEIRDGSSNEVKSGDFLVLFGTGIRRAVTGSITITIGGKSAPVLFAGPQGGFAGLDQINTQVPSESRDSLI
jgi:uncharacterized protein (TIGR03437 family)